MSISANSILIRFLSDNESLFEYERNINSKDYIILFDSIKRRLIAQERLNDIIKNDAHYEVWVKCICLNTGIFLNSFI